MASHSERVAKLLAKVWSDPKEMARLKADPAGVLKEAGFKPAGKVHLHEDNDADTHFVIPKRPAGLSDEDLKSGKVHIDLCCTFV
jgi:hypothetical protein